ncbi:MAG: sigma 54-interacting transcriptional regulator [Bryobacterales bacterium]|nr:sigma 54-interacting transcriptional regulator [Bryobacterales bacterium]
MNCRIVAVSGPRCGLEFALPSRENFVGRDPSNTIQVDHPSVSRNHCVIRRGGEEWTVRDLESRNGTFVNRIPVRERVLRPGDELQVGDCVFLFLPEAPSERTGPLPEPLAQGDVTRTLVLRPEDSRYLTPGKVDAELAADAANHRGARLARELDALLSISVSIHSLRGVEAISHRLLEAAMEVTPACRGAVWLPASTFAWQRDNGPIEAPAELLALIAGVAQEQAAMLSEVSSAPGTMAATAPILCFGNILGVLVVQGSAGSPLNADHLQLLRAIAVIAGPALDHAAQVEMLEGENRRLLNEAVIEHGMVGEGPAMRKILRLIARVAQVDSTVLVRGESGTGKELVAQAIHANSLRAAKPFVAINCATLSETLLESELFGHEKGAFTGAIAQKRGKLEVAGAGTVFLDEVCEMAPALQAKLLRVLQQREFERVGGTRSLRTDARFIAATNRDMEEAVESGAFRHDLFYRLNVIPLVLPPLRERREDIPLLAGFFVARYAEKTGRKVRGISLAARAYLTAYDWPGNVRELENVMERAVALGSAETVMPEDLPEALLEGPAPPGISPGGYHQALVEAKKQLILSAIEKAGGSHAAAAKLLGLHPNYLSRLIRNLNLKNALKTAGLP